MPFGRITNHPEGINTGENPFFRKWPYPDPSLFSHISKNFMKYDANEWDVTETQVGVPTFTILDQPHGILEVVNSGADDDLVSHQWKAETFSFPLNKRNHIFAACF